MARAAEAELSVNDFSFDAPLGSQGARIERIEKNHFKVTLGHAPGHPNWPNHLQFRILRNAKGNDLTLTVVFVSQGKWQYGFTGNHSSWSYDGKNWVHKGWGRLINEDDTHTTVLTFPPFEQDTVWFGWQVPMTYEDQVELIEGWQKHPAVKVHVLGKSLQGRDLYRIEIREPESPYPPEQRWVHYFANQHPGETNSMWRMAGMVDWLLSEEGANARQRLICHFVLMMSPDGVANGWHRVNLQGVDMNRSYSRQGANKGQAHEVYIFQKDLEGIMLSDCAATTIWSMHVWPGPADPIITPGPEIDNVIGPATEFAELLERCDPEHKLVKKLRIRGKLRPRSTRWAPPPPDRLPEGGTGTWSGGPGQQFGVTNLLCEGGAGLHTKEENIDSGVVLIKALADYYRGTKPAKPEAL
jgi:hypothetical protein